MRTLAPPQMMSTRAAAEIRAAILNGSLSPGSRVRQEELAARLGVSREPIRKALLMLEREGLVSNVVNRGLIVAPIDLPLIGEIYEIREVLEGYAAGKIAQLPDFDVTEFRKILAQGRKATRSGPVDKVVDWDFVFHSQLYQACGNRVVLETMRTQWGHIRRALLMLLSSLGYRKQVWDEHEAIVDAIEKKDAAEAKARAIAHVQGAYSWLKASLHSGTPKKEWSREEE